MYNDRFVLFARSNGRTPEEQKAAQLGNAEYLAWLSTMQRRFRAVSPHSFVEGRMFDDKGFDAFLEREASKAA